MPHSTNILVYIHLLTLGGIASSLGLRSRKEVSERIVPTTSALLHTAGIKYAAGSESFTFVHTKYKLREGFAGTTSNRATFPLLYMVYGIALARSH